MNDTVVKGTGNSRTLKTVPNALTLYPDFPSMMQALIAGTFPIDIGPLNAAGVSTRGTDLNKAALLKDATAALYGKTAAATQDDILAAIRPLITAAQNTADGKVACIYGNWVGDQTSRVTISVPGKPVAFSAFCSNSAMYTYMCHKGSGMMPYMSSNNNPSVYLSWNDTSLVLNIEKYNSSYNWNVKNYWYYYVIFYET